MRKRDWIHTAADQRAWDEGCRPDPAAAQKVRDFFRKFLRHSKGEFAGQPFELLEWQWRDVIRPLFAWKRPDGTRRYRLGYIEVPKKNGKSTLMSGIGLFLLIADGEPGAEVYSAAADHNQASIIFNEAANMVESSPALSAILSINRTNKQITYARQRAWYKALSAEAPTKEGLNIHGLLFDELHAQKTPELWDALRYGGAARRQPLLLAITTAGYDRESICWRQHERARKVLEGLDDDPTFFAYLRAAPEEADWTDPEVWKAANPSWGVTIKADTFEADCREAQEMPTQENTFRRYRLNQWTQQSVRLLPMDKWDRCDGPADEDLLMGRECWAGLDLASVEDVAALCLVFPEGDRCTVLPYFWIPEQGAANRDRRDGVPYLTWARQGLIELTPGESIDFQFIRRRINELDKQFRIQKIAIDPWNARQIELELRESDGFDTVLFRQGYGSMNAPTKLLLGMVLSGRLAHGANPVLRWMADNVSSTKDAADNIKPNKEKSSEKIDGIVALIMGLDLVSLRSDPTSVYEEAGQLAL